VPRRGVLAAGLLGVLGLAGCTSAGPIRLDRSVAVPTPPPPSAAELARRQVAGGSATLLDALQRIDPATAPGDTGARLPAWVDVHRSHLVTLAEPQPVRPLGLPVAGAPSGASSLVAPDAVLTATGLLRALTSQGVDIGLVDPALGTLALRIAAARSAQDLLLRTAAGQSITVAAWPPDAPVEAAQSLLAAEHAAFDAYTTATAWADTRQQDLQRRRRAHEGVRDQLTAILLAAGQRPVPAEAGYALPPEVLPGTPLAADPNARALQLAVTVEGGLSRAAMSAAATMLADQSAPAGVPLAMLRATVALVGDVEATRQLWGAAPDPLPGS